MTDNIERRFEEHNRGKSIFTRKYKPWVLIYKEQLADAKEARMREKYLKSASGRRFLKDKIFNEV